MDPAMQTRCIDRCIGDDRRWRGRPPGSPRPANFRRLARRSFPGGLVLLRFMDCPLRQSMTKRGPIRFDGLRARPILLFSGRDAGRAVRRFLRRRRGCVRALTPGRRLEDRLIVVLEQRDQRDVGGVIFPGARTQAQRAAHEHRRQLRDQFLGGVGAQPNRPDKSRFGDGVGPVRDLVQATVICARWR